MKLTFACLLSLTTGCSLSTAPSAQVVAQHHNIPATFKGQESGPIIYLCATQPRIYVTADGRRLTEEDHYLQYEPCPAVPIN